MRTREFLIATLLLACAAIFLRQIGHGEALPIRKNLADFPRSIEPWDGKDLSIDPEVLKKLSLDDYLLREYQSSEDKVLLLYIGFYKSQREGATYHSPKNCLPGSGWEILHSETVTIPNYSGEDFRINMTLIQKGLDKQLVLYWYHDRGRVIASEYWAKIFLVWDAITRNRTDGTLARVNIPLVGSPEETYQYGKTFVIRLLPLLSEFLPG